MWHTNIFLYETLEKNEIEYYKVRGKIEDLYSLHLSTILNGHCSCISLPETVLYIFKGKPENLKIFQVEKFTSKIEEVVTIYLKGVKNYLLQKWNKKFNDFVFYKLEFF